MTKVFKLVIIHLMKNTTHIVLLLLTFTLTSCANKINKMGRDVKYSAYEMVGYEKRDLFKSQVGKVKSCLLYTSPSPRDRG